MFRLRNFINQIKPESLTRYLGLGLPAGANQYRAYVGPPDDYDLISAMTFNLLTTLGVRQHNTILDIGCGSLRIGRLLIPYLNIGNYVGIEPNKWLVNEGIQYETGQDQIRIKQPRFYYSDSTRDLPRDELYDFAIAQSIFSHCGPNLVEQWLRGISSHLQDSGALVATFLIGEQDCQENGWFYPDCVYYTVETMEILAQNAGLKLLLLDWNHPRQTWGLYAKPNFDATWFEDKLLTWNTYLNFASPSKKNQPYDTTS